MTEKSLLARDSWKHLAGTAKITRNQQPDRKRPFVISIPLTSEHMTADGAHTFAADLNAHLQSRTLTEKPRFKILFPHQQRHRCAQASFAHLSNAESALGAIRDAGINVSLGVSEELRQYGERHTKWLNRPWRAILEAPPKPHIPLVGSRTDLLSGSRTDRTP